MIKSRLIPIDQREAADLSNLNAEWQKNTMFRSPVKSDALTAFLEQHEIICSPKNLATLFFNQETTFGASLSASKNSTLAQIKNQEETYSLGATPTPPQTPRLNASPAEHEAPTSRRSRRNRKDSSPAQSNTKCVFSNTEQKNVKQ